jgi:hypothetical protein
MQGVVGLGGGGGERGVPRTHARPLVRDAHSRRLSPRRKTPSPSLPLSFPLPSLSLSLYSDPEAADELEATLRRLIAASDRVLSSPYT